MCDSRVGGLLLVLASANMHLFSCLVLSLGYTSVPRETAGR